MKIKTFVSMDYFSCNMFVCSSSKGNFIVDPGFYDKRVKKYLNEIGGIDFILITHGHFDHIGGLNDILLDYPNVKVYAFSLENEVIYNPNKNMASDVDDRGKEFHKYVPNIDLIPLDEGETKINNYLINVIHTPGHTIGGCIYIFNEENVCFMGDTIICESIGRYDLPTASYSELVTSIKKIKSLSLNDEMNCYFGHGYMMTYKNLLSKNLFLRNA